MKEKKERKKWGLILFLVVIMIGTSFSFIFYGLSPVSDKIKYNGYTFTFVPSQNIWIAKIQGRDAAFSFLPKDVETVSLLDDSIKKLQSKLEIDATYAPNSTYREAIALAQHQMGLTLAQYSVFVRKGFAANNTFNLPVITCDDATALAPVIYFKKSETSSQIIEGSCITLNLRSRDEAHVIKDMILLGVLGLLE